MKKHAATLLILMVFALPALLNAQTARTTIKATIPFEFVVGGKTMPAGEYNIQVLRDSGASVLVSNRYESAYALPFSTSSAQPQKVADHTALVFHDYGDRHFLAGISLEGSDRGYGMKESKLESELRAQNVVERDETFMASIR
jgi:hypothetical protein